MLKIVNFFSAVIIAHLSVKVSEVKTSSVMEYWIIWDDRYNIANINDIGES